MSVFASVLRGLVIACASNILGTSTSAAISQMPQPTSAGSANSQLSDGFRGDQLISDVNDQLSENEAYVGECRETNGTVEVFNNVDLGPVTTRVGTFSQNTEVALTGVLAPGKAQVYRRLSDDSIDVLGWIDASFLTSCDQSQPIPQAPTSQACFSADFDLIVRDEPTTTSAVVGTFNRGDVIYATSMPPVELTSSPGVPNYGRVWLQVAYRGEEEWLAKTGRNGIGTNVTRLSDAVCQASV